MHEFGETETEWEAEFRRARAPQRAVGPRVVRRSPFRPQILRAALPQRPPQLPPRRISYPIVQSAWGTWAGDGEPPTVEPRVAEPGVLGPVFAEPTIAVEPSGDGAATSEPSADDQPSSEEFQPEAFEFESKFGENENEFLGGGEPKRSGSCSSCRAMRAMCPIFSGSPALGQINGQWTTARQEHAMTDQLYIQPEAFEFEFALDERESGLNQIQSSFSEFEGSQPKRTGMVTCPGYARGEVEKSRTQAGHLPSDVIEHARGLLIADFGVDWRSPKASVKKNPLLQKWLNTISAVASANPSTSIRITGFSDCVGKENNNTFLRRGRARRVHQLLYELLGPGPKWKYLQSRIKTGAAPSGDYVADNSTVTGRAQNRGALIENTENRRFRGADHRCTRHDRADPQESS